MKKSLSRVLLLAGVVAAAGVAQAETFNTPTQAGEASTMTQGAPNLLTDNPGLSYGVQGGVDTRAMGAGPATITGYETTTVYGMPSTHLWPERRDGATATFNVPGRAGEASTMTNGVPNVSTSNYTPPVLGSVVVPVITVD
jgi:hypothetical protein